MKYYLIEYVQVGIIVALVVVVVMLAGGLDKAEARIKSLEEIQSKQLELSEKQSQINQQQGVLNDNVVSRILAL